MSNLNQTKEIIITSIVFIMLFIIVLIVVMESSNHNYNNQSSTTQSSNNQPSNSEFADYSYEVSSYIRNTIGYEVEMMWRSSESVYKGSMINWYEQKKHSFTITVDSEGNLINANVGYGEPLY
jgi:hypothetical protein